MIHSKNHKGFSFIEMMVALAMLAIFGTSIMIVQTSLFEKLIKGHTRLMNMLVIDQYIVQFNEQIQQALQDKKEISTITLHHDNKNPEYSVDIKINPIPANSTLVKKFALNIGITQITIQQDTVINTWHALICTKALDTKPEKKTDSEKSMPNKEVDHES